ncbi:MAG: Hsp20/alpha crystallin family protein [Motilibacteraceae bacterium]
MAISRWDPFTALARLDTEFDDLVRRAWGATGAAGAMASRGEGFVPAIDMTTEGDDVVISVELPGVDVAKDVDLEVGDGRLVISGHREERSERTERIGGEGGRLLVREMRSGSFRREFALPEGVGADDIEASYDQGILEVRVRHVTKPVPEPRKVPIRGTEPAGSGRGTIEGGKAESRRIEARPEGSTISPD